MQPYNQQYPQQSYDQYPQQQLSPQAQQYPPQAYSQQPYAPAGMTTVVIQQPAAAAKGLDPMMFIILDVVGLLTGFTGIQRFATRDYCQGLIQLAFSPTAYGILGLFTFGISYLIMFFFVGYVLAIIDLLRANAIVDAYNKRRGL